MRAAAAGCLAPPPSPSRTHRHPHPPHDSHHPFSPLFFTQVTHKGLDSSSGHYISFVRQDTATSTWHAFDDDSVEVTDSEVVSRMKGGGNDFMAYLLFYKAREEGQGSGGGAR